MDTQRRSPHSNVRESAMEMLLDGAIFTDYATAHNRAGDPTYKTFLPGSCAKCRKQAEEAEAAQRAWPSKPDEAWLNDQPS